MLKNEKRPGYKKTKVGWIPDDWKCVPLGQVFKKRTARGKQGVPVFSVTQDRGMIPRTSLERRTGNDVTADKSLLVEPGDVAYNMMRMWQGAVAVCEERCVISPAYVVCRPNAGQVDSNFMFSYFKSKAGMYKLCAYSYGVTADRLRLYYEDFSRVLAPLPSFPEQIAIAEALNCWDKVIKTLELKIGKKKLVKQGLTQKLLSGRTRLPGFSEKWKHATFLETFEIQKGTKSFQVQTSEYQESGHYPIVDQGQNKIVAFTDIDNVYSKVPVIVFGDHTRIVKWIDFPFVIGADGTQLIKSRKEADLHFGHFLISNLELTSLGYSRHLKLLKECEFGLPPLEEQRAIAAVLSASDGEIEALERKLALLNDQKKFLLNNLVPGTIRLPQFCKAARKGDRHE